MLESTTLLPFGFGQGNGTPFILAVLLLVAFVLLLRIFALPSLDPREPPPIWPTIPLIGHILSIATGPTAFHKRIADTKTTSAGAVTLPMLSGKMYFIRSPAMIAAALRNPDLSLDLPALPSVSGIVGMQPETLKKLEVPGVLEGATQAMHDAMLGDNLKTLTARALGILANLLNDLPHDSTITTTIPSAQTWLRDLISLATGPALWGKQNMFDLPTMQHVFTIEQKLMILATNFLPTLLAPDALASRGRLNAAMRPFYESKTYATDPSVSVLIRNRALHLSTTAGLTDAEIANIEWMMAFSATTNTAPLLHWLFAHVFSRADYASRVAAEIKSVTTIEDEEENTAVIDLSDPEKRTPFLHACLQESQRLYNEVVAIRQPRRDTHIADPSTGERYLLAKGTNIQWAALAPHRSAAVWGGDVDEFRPERWTDDEVSAADAKKRRGAMIGFGGGRFLCPGRMFARAEILGVVSVLAAGFEVEGVVVPRSGWAPGGLGMRVVIEGGDKEMRDVRIRRKEGLEDVKWSIRA